MNIKDIGQLFITGISGLSLTDEEKSFIEENNIGGVILFKNNYKDPAQLAELVNEIQTLRDDYPLFVSVDQEGGRVQRFRSHFIQLPPMNDFGRLDSPKLTFEAHKILAEELSACGVNLSYSPCCDVWTNEVNKVIGDRSFGSEVSIVEKNVSGAIRGLHSANVLSCAKHFPGHGDTAKDSHYDLPYIKKSLDELRKLEFAPFVKAAKSRVEFVMMAHLVVDAIDPKLPCTLSKPAYDILREELKYQKIIITDDMEMQAISDNYSYAEAAVMALGAGADIILYRSLEKAREALAGVKEALKKQQLKNASMGDKINRVIDCKKRFLSEYKPIYIPDVGNKFNQENHSSILSNF